MAKTRNRPKPKAAVMDDKPVFKVGDRVTYHAGDYGNGLLNSKTGTVIYVDGTRWPYTVEFDFVVDTNMAVTDYRACKHGIEPRPFHGWFCRPRASGGGNMRANTRGRISEANKPRVTMMRYNIRAQAQAEVQKLVNEAEAKRQNELEAYARVLDETMLYALHTFPKRRFGKKLLREFWDHMYRTRLDARIFFRDGTSAYEEQETGKNIEDLGIRAELAKLGIRMDEWLQEEMVLTDEQEAALRGGKR